MEEVIQFARKIGAHKLGIATCAGLLDESRTLAKILRTNGFEVYGAVCKMGANPKVSIGIPKECEAVGVNMCNPIMQRSPSTKPTPISISSWACALVTTVSSLNIPTPSSLPS